MGDSRIPSFAVPLAKGYRYQRGSNLIGTPVQGGIFRAELDYLLESVEIGVVFPFTNIQKAGFFDWFDSTINHGANSFVIPLETDTDGLVDHQARFKPGSVKVTTLEGLNFRVVCVLVVETTPSQFAPFGGELYPLVEEYGEQLEPIIDRLAQLVNVDFSVFT